ncbi:DUF1542 domain-containing protein [Staphylococcus aureus]|nr:DUF1542 domain-containing protein [Staphylococcus aureus]
MQILLRNQQVKELDQAAADKKTQIEQTPNASQQEINDAKQEVDTELNQAKTNVDQSSTNEYVDNAVKEGKAKINAVKTFSEYKKDALAKIEDAYNAKVNEADNSNASTSSEIAEAKQKLAELKQTADQNVNQATSKDDIEVQIHNDLDNINDYTIPTGKKNQLQQIYMLMQIRRKIIFQLTLMQHKMKSNKQLSKLTKMFKLH